MQPPHAGKDNDTLSLYLHSIVCLKVRELSLLIRFPYIILRNKEN